MLQGSNTEKHPRILWYKSTPLSCSCWLRKCIPKRWARHQEENNSKVVYLFPILLHLLPILSHFIHTFNYCYTIILYFFSNNNVLFQMFKLFLPTNVQSWYTYCILIFWLISIDKAKPVLKQGRKAKGSDREIAWLP